MDVTAHSHNGNGFYSLSPVIQGDIVVLESPTVPSALRILCCFPPRTPFFKEVRRKCTERHFLYRSHPEQFAKTRAKKSKILNENGKRNYKLVGTFPLQRLASWGLQVLCGLPGLSEGRNLPTPPVDSSFGVGGLVPILATVSCVFKQTRGPARSLRNIHLCTYTGP